jgi:LacI family transcriptional regulator
MRRRTVTIVDVAREAGVSTATVSNVLNRRNVPLSEEVIRRVEEAADRLGYRRNAMAASLSRRRTFELGLLVPSFNGYFGRFAEACEKAAHAHGYHLSVFSGQNDPELECRHLDSLLQRRVDGLLCHGLAMSFDATRAVVRDGTPMVLFNAWGWPDDIAVGAVNLDFGQGCAEAVRLLYERGCRFLAYVGRPRSGATDAERRAGFRRGMAMLAPDAEGVDVDVTGTEFEAAFREVMCRADGRRPIGVIGFDDSVAFGVMCRALAAGVRVPDELKVVGMNNDFVAQHAHPGLTTMDIPYREQAELAVRWLVSAISGESDEGLQARTGGRPQVDIPVRLVLRGSTGD